MKNFIKLFIFLILIACNSQSNDDKAIEIFEKTLGEDGVIVFNTLIPIAENKLMQTYGVTTPNLAYKEFLKDVAIKNICGGIDLKIPQTELKNVLNLFEKNNFRREIWILTKEDSKILLDFNVEGKYLNAFKKASGYNEIAFNYYDLRNITGEINYGLVAKALLKNDRDLDNYFIKRIVIADFIYMNLICTNSYELTIY
jgi:hypothetical protein